ncbi:Os10g0327325, partial [Oryza sativa Japonica Group]
MPAILSSLNPGSCLSSLAFLSRLKSSLAIKIWITTTIAHMYRCPMYIKNTNPAIIQSEEYVRISIDLYLFWSFSSKLAPLVLFTSDGA